MKHKLLPSIFILILSAGFAGCDTGTKFSTYSNFDLQKAYAECQRGGHSAAGAQRCRNIEKECNKRKEKSGFRC